VDNLTDQLEAYASTLIGRLRNEPSVVDVVRKALAEGLLSGLSKEADVARQLAMTTRTVHRRLADAGTSFRKIRDELIRRRAEELRA